MNSTFSRRVGLGLASSTLAQVIAGLNAFLLVPFFLRAWGAEGYGRWLALTALIAYLKLLDLGGQSYIGNLLALAFARQEDDHFRRVLSTGVSLFVWLCLGVFAGVLLLLAWPDLPFPGLDRPLTAEERVVFGCMAASLLIAIPGGVYVTVYRSTGLFARGTMLGNLLRLLTLGVAIGLLSAGVGMGGYAAAMLGAGVVMTVVIIWDAQHHVPQSKGIRISLANARAGRVYLRGSLYFWLIALAGALNQQGVILVVTAFISPVAVAVYATHRAAASLLGYISTILQGPLWPEISFLYAQQRFAELGRAVVTLTGLMMLASGVAAIGLYMFLPFIYPLWTGNTLEMVLPLFGILLLQGVLAAAWFAPNMGLLACNHHQRLAGWTLLNALVTIAGALVLARPLGVVGVALASLVGDITCSLIVVPRLAARYLHVSAIRLFRTIIVALLALIGFAALAAWLSAGLSLWPALVGYSLAVLLLGYPALLLVLGRAEASNLVHKFQAAALTVFMAGYAKVRA